MIENCEYCGEPHEIERFLMNGTDFNLCPNHPQVNPAMTMIDLSALKSEASEKFHSSIERIEPQPSDCFNYSHPSPPTFNFYDSHGRLRGFEYESELPEIKGLEYIMPQKPKGKILMIDDDDSFFRRAFRHIEKPYTPIFPPPHIGYIEDYCSSPFTASPVLNHDKPLFVDTMLKMETRFMPIQPALDIQITDYLPGKFIQKRRHKRKSSKRWQKKYLKRFGTIEVRTGEILKIGNKLVMDRQSHAEVMQRITEGFDDYRREFERKFFDI